MSLDAAIARYQQGQLAEAERLCREILRSQPGQADALHLLGILALQTGKPQAAADLIGRSLGSDPEQPLACLNLGVAYQRLNRLEEALGCYDRALQFVPDYADALNNRGDVLMEMRRPAEALQSLEHALRLVPNFATALNNRGNALRALDRADEALSSYDQALRLEPSSARTLNNRGSALRDLGKLEEALGSFEAALRLDPAYALALHNRGNVLLELDRREGALDSYQRALQLRPDYRDALYGVGMSLTSLNRFEEAQRHFQRVCDLEPAYPYARGHESVARWRVCDWADAARRRRDLTAAVQQGVPAIVPMLFLAVSDSAAAQLKCAQTFVAHRHPQRETRACRPAYRHDRIRLAYVSGDLRDHVVARLLAGVFEKHDRRRFEINAIALRPADNRPFGQRVCAAFDRFIDVTRESDAGVAARMRDMEIDIAVDLAGFTEGCRPGIFAHRGAPVQVNYIGFPATVGAPYMDYIIADEILIPPAARIQYTEQVACLPDCFHPTDDTRPRPVRASRAELGFPEDAVVCCCLNNSYKYNELMFDLWARLLTRAPRAVLWLIADDASTAVNLRREATSRGISHDRLVLSGRTSYEDHLARLACADLFLDTWPFNAGATASDALWAGVPLLTCMGDAFAARMAGSLLHAVGLSELVTSSLEEYERLALSLITTPARLAEVRSKLETARERSPLFDTERYCRNLEAAFQMMWERSERGEPPAPIRVESDGIRERLKHG